MSVRDCWLPCEAVTVLDCVTPIDVATARRRVTLVPCDVVRLYAVREVTLSAWVWVTERVREDARPARMLLGDAWEEVSACVTPLAIVVLVPWANATEVEMERLSVTPVVCDTLRVTPAWRDTEGVLVCVAVRVRALASWRETEDVLV